MKGTFCFISLIAAGILISGCASSKAANNANNPPPLQLTIGDTINYSLFIEKTDPFGLTIYELKNYWLVTMWGRNPRRVTVRLDDDKKIRGVDYQFGIDDQILTNNATMEAIRLFDEDAARKGMKVTQNTINPEAGFDNGTEFKAPPGVDVKVKTYALKHEGWGMTLLISGLPEGRFNWTFSLLKLLPEDEPNSNTASSTG
jgi:hypothetical protein